MNWHSGSIADAVSEAKRRNKLILVYIEGPDDLSKQMNETYNDPAVVQKLSSTNIVALKLQANSVPYQQFCAIYPVIVIPSSFFIGINGSPIEIFTGSLAPAEFCNKMDILLETYEKSLAQKLENTASTSSAPDVSLPSTFQDNMPSTSQSSSNADSLKLQEKVERAKALVEAQRQSKAEEEQEKERKQEIERRNMGKAIQQAEQSKKDNEMKEWAKNRAKEKEEERLAREKVKAMIAQDRAERAARYQQTKEAEERERERLARQREETERAARDAAMKSNDARIQFRMPDGSFTTHSFSADATLEEARRFVKDEVRPPFSSFTFCTTFPRRHFTETNYAESLRDLQLAPSAVLLILPVQTVSHLSPPPGFFSSLIWMFVAPFAGVYNYIRSWLGGSPPATNAPPSQTQPPTASESTKASPPQTESNTRRRESPFAKREGNIHRINNQSDDDENNTWNGNSTQQM